VSLLFLKNSKVKADLSSSIDELRNVVVESLLTQNELLLHQNRKLLDVLELTQESLNSALKVKLADTAVR